MRSIQGSGHVDVVLINGNFAADRRSYANSAPAPGLAHIAAVLELNSIQVRIIDPPPQGLSKTDVVRYIGELSPCIVGISCLTTSRYDALELAQMTKSAHPEMHIVMGGPHATFVDGPILQRVEAVEAIVRGEGENTFRDYVEAVLGGASLDGILGLTYQDRNGEVIRNAARPLIENLDDLPLPAYHLFPDLDKYAGQDSMPDWLRGARAAPLVSSRGCPWDCVFCSSKRLWGGRKAFRARSASRIVDEIEYLIDRFKVNYIRFQDDCFTADRDRVLHFCRTLLERNVRVAWRAESRIDRVDSQLLLEMKEAGCHLVEYGIESGSQRVIDKVNKRIDLGLVPEVVRMTRASGMQAKGFFILGLPGETRADFQRTMTLSREFDYAGVAAMMVFPGSPLCAKMTAEGLINDDVWFTYRAPSIAGCSENVPLYTASFDRMTLHELYRLMELHRALPNTRAHIGSLVTKKGFFDSDTAKAALRFARQYLRLQLLCAKYGLRVS